MKSTFRTLIGALGVCATMTGPALASLPPDALKSLPQSPSLGLGARVLEPFAEVIFCRKNPRECRSNETSRQLDMSPMLMQQLASVNRQVNRSIAPKEDDSNYMGGNVWQLAPRAGDCEDFAITKRHELIDRGIPAGALRLAIVHTWQGESHMVLVVSTTGGDMVLDNLTSQILPWRETRLSWEMIQSAANPREWHSVQLG